MPKKKKKDVVVLTRVPGTEGKVEDELFDRMMDAKDTLVEAALGYAYSHDLDCPDGEALREAIAEYVHADMILFEFNQAASGL